MKIDIKYLLLTLFMVLAAPAISYSQNDSVADAQAEQMYKEVAEMLNKIDSSFNKEKAEEPEIFSEIDALYDQYKDKAQLLMKTTFAEQGINVDRIKNIDKEELTNAISEGFNKAFNDPQAANLKAEITKLIMEAQEQGYSYTPKMYRDPVGFAQDMAVKDPQAVMGVAKFLEGNKDAIVAKIKEGVEESKKREKFSAAKKIQERRAAGNSSFSDN